MATRKASSSCSHCWTTKDANGQPVTYCTGLCNVIVLSIVEKFKEVADKINAGKTVQHCIQQ